LIFKGKWDTIGSTFNKCGIFMLQPARRVYDWASTKVQSPYAPLWLGGVFLFELVLFIPFDALLMFFCMQNPQRRFFYASMATLASLVTGAVGFLVGYWLWDTVGSYVVGHLISRQFFANLVAHYNAHEHLAVVIGSLLPIPFKAVTLSAGFCQLSFWPFAVSVLLARAVRFFFIAEMMHRFGDRIKAFIDRHFSRILMALGAKIALTFTFFLAMGL
jgi:membrane protein YqaA with SNARE-associated domain